MQKRLELLDQGKIQLMIKRANILNEEIVNLQGSKDDIKALKHSKDEIDDMYKSAEKVKDTLANLHSMMDRFE